jgi:hypothetical protein
MKKSDQFRENAETCAELAETARNEPLRKRYTRMVNAWKALAEEEDWLAGELSPRVRDNAPEAPTS